MSWPVGWNHWDQRRCRGNKKLGKVQFRSSDIYKCLYHMYIRCQKQYARGRVFWCTTKPTGTLSTSEALVKLEKVMWTLSSGNLFWLISLSPLFHLIYWLCKMYAFERNSGIVILLVMSPVCCKACFYFHSSLITTLSWSGSWGIQSLYWEQ